MPLLADEAAGWLWLGRETGFRSAHVVEGPDTRRVLGDGRELVPGLLLHVRGDTALTFWVAATSGG